MKARTWRSYLEPQEVAGGAAVIGGLIVLLVPLPPGVLDLLLAGSIAASVAVLLWGLRAEGPADFWVLPQALVAGSAGRVVLAIAAARTIVAYGNGGTFAQSVGQQLTGEGENLFGGLLVVGLLLLACYVVISAGLTRLAEVAARFALDALPGRQMALESAISGGIAERQKAAAERERWERENAFYGAMDGAARFVRGETIAVAALIGATPLIGIVRGGGMSAGTEYVLSALGLGALLLLAGLLMSIGAAIVMTRGQGHRSGEEPGVWGRPAVGLLVAFALVVLAAAPGVAKGPLAVVAVIVGVFAWASGRRRQPKEAGAPAAEMQLRIGTNLLALTAGGELLQWLNRQRAKLADELGFAMPPFVVRDEETLGLNEFAIVINGATVTRGILRPGRLLAVPSEGEREWPEGERVWLPDGREGVWVRVSEGRELRGAEIRWLEPWDVLAIYVQAAVRERAAELFSLQRAREILEAVRVSHPAVVEAFFASGLTERELQQVGQALLAERVPLAERVTLLTRLAEIGPGPLPKLVEEARQALRQTITRLVAPEGTLYAWELSEALRQELRQAVLRAGEGEPVTLSPARTAHWHQMLRWAEKQGEGSPGEAVVLVPADLRRAVAQLAGEAGARVWVVHVGELLPLTEIVCVGVITEQEAGTIISSGTGE